MATDAIRCINEIRKEWGELAPLVPSYDQRLVEEVRSYAYILSTATLAI